jgi:hypothetical protein
MTILARFQVAEHVAGDQLAALVVAVRVVGLEDAQAVRMVRPGVTTRKPRVNFLLRAGARR